MLGGQGEPIVAVLKDGYRADLTLAEALALAIRGLGTVGGDNGKPRELAANQLEVAVLDRALAGPQVPPAAGGGADRAAAARRRGHGGRHARAERERLDRARRDRGPGGRLAD